MLKKKLQTLLKRLLNRRYFWYWNFFWNFFWSSCFNVHQIISIVLLPQQCQSLCFKQNKNLPSPERISRLWPISLAKFLMHTFFSKAPIRLVNKWTTKLLSDSKPSSDTRSSTNRQFFSTRSIPILPTIEYSTHIDAFYKAREETEGLVIGLAGWMLDFIISWPVESVYLLSEHLTKKNA